MWVHFSFIYPIRIAQSFFVFSFAVGKEGYEATARPPPTNQTAADDDDSEEDPYATDGDSDEEFEPRDASDDDDVFDANTE